jgi:hypothetical protein
MSIGSAFDAYVKSFLVDRLFGLEQRPEFELASIFEEQVEPEHRDWAWEAGKYAFECYKRSGALLNLLTDLRGSSVDPRFEFTVTSEVRLKEDHATGVVFLGKPDCWFVTAEGTHVIPDWKVNGFCSKKSAVSPKKGYVTVLDGWGPDRAPASRGYGNAHKDANVVRHEGILMSVGHTLENIDHDWALAAAIYAWLLGEPVGSDFVAGIEQIVAKPDQVDRPLLRVASFRNNISQRFQVELFLKAAYVWRVAHSDYIFTDLTLEQSQEKCAALDRLHHAFSDTSAKGKWFTQRRGR